MRRRDVQDKDPDSGEGLSHLEKKKNVMRLKHLNTEKLQSTERKRQRESKGTS